MKKELVKAIVSGSYDPFTYGHLTMVKQAAEIFDEVHVMIFINAKKKHRDYDADLMVEAIKETLKEEGITNCIVGYDTGLLAYYCKKHGIKYNIRGLRDNMDYNYEVNISEANKLINEDLKTMYVQAESKISSTTVKELISYDVDVSKFVPKPVYKVLMQQRSLQKNDSKTECYNDGTSSRVMHC